LASLLRIPLAVDKPDLFTKPEVSLESGSSKIRHGTLKAPSPPAPTSLIDANRIACTWPSCYKTFVTNSDYNHHCRYHNLAFQCPTCPAQHATKRELDRHINSCHTRAEKYYCTISNCKRSILWGGAPFSREDNCRRHMKRKHKMTDIQVETCAMDDETKRIRKQRKVERRIGI
jgi:hypothetical protein